MRTPLALLLLLCAAPAGAALHYQARLSDDAEHLAVRLCTDQALPALRLIGDRERGRPYLREAAHEDGRVVRLHPDSFETGNLAAGDCLHYRIDIGDAARAGRYGLGWHAGDYLMLPLEAWFWRPQRLPEGSTLALRLPAGWSASLPFRPVDDGGRNDGTNYGSKYRLSQTPPGWEGFSAFGRFAERRLELPGGRIRVSVLPLADAAHGRALHEWVAANARTLLGSFGRLPLPDTQVLVVPLPGVRSPVPWAQSTRGGGNALQVFAGLDASEAARADDWTLAHEFSHLFHPYLGDRGRWLGEGLASYFQNVLRARSGELSSEEAWRRLDAGFGRGLRERASHGRPLGEVAAGFRATMRVYWSGAAFWLEADAALRESYGTCLDAVLADFAARHLPAGETWAPERFVAELDTLAGTELFVPLYREYARSTRFPDLDETYRRLGLGDGIGALRLSSAAPAIATREAIMAPSAQLAGTAIRQTGR